MNKPYDAVVSEINHLLTDNRLSVAETLNAMKNIRDHVEPWIDALQEDLAKEAGE